MGSIRLRPMRWATAIACDPRPEPPLVLSADAGTSAVDIGFLLWDRERRNRVIHPPERFGPREMPSRGTGIP
ncbi:hypothetical protein GCM10010405_14480 [Streptomyces macrosporus]|uniref:Uncharacterized protein n=1 Tax=Streptomyces macrosporus TaxID=44032 RepID=A0ABP5WSQ1_9ACTN